MDGKRSRRKRRLRECILRFPGRGGRRWRLVSSIIFDVRNIKVLSASLKFPRISTHRNIDTLPLAPNYGGTEFGFSCRWCKLYVSVSERKSIMRSCTDNSIA